MYLKSDIWDGPCAVTETRPDETALATLGRLDIADVPDMGYDPWSKADRKRSGLREARKGMVVLGPIMTTASLALLWLAYFTPGPAFPIFVHILFWFVFAACAGLPAYIFIDATYKLGRLPDPLSLLPPGSSPELAVREHELVLRIEAHNRNVRLLRGMPVIDPEELEKARNEERELRGGSLALAEAKSDIAGLLED